MQQQPERELSLTEVLESKTYVKPNSAIDFKSPKFYLEPFLEVMEKNNIEYRIKTGNPVINLNAEDSSENVAYSRVLVESKIGENVPGFFSVIGIIYALDLQKPVIKIYSGENACVCTNLTIFQADRVFTQDMLGNFNDTYQKARVYLNEKAGEIERFKETYNTLTKTQLDQNELNRVLGYLLRVSSTGKLGTTPIVQASARLDDPQSVYYAQKEGTNLFNVYNAVTQSITNSKEFLDKPNKTVELSEMILKSVKYLN